MSSVIRRERRELKSSRACASKDSPVDMQLLMIQLWSATNLTLNNSSLVNVERIPGANSIAARQRMAGSSRFRCRMDEAYLRSGGLPALPRFLAGPLPWESRPTRLICRHFISPRCACRRPRAPKMQPPTGVSNHSKKSGKSLAEMTLYAVILNLAYATLVLCAAAGGMVSMTPRCSVDLGHRRSSALLKYAQEVGIEWL